MSTPCGTVCRSSAPLWVCWPLSWCSPKVAVFIFITHLATLILLLLVGGWFLFGHGFSIFIENWQMPTEGGIGRALFFGFAAAMLGISGFESSSNFVEEQAEGVFPKTLNNMWVAVSFFNPAIALLALAMIRIPDVEGHKEALLSHIGYLAGGPWLSWFVSVDAALVLSGAVLTSYVGVNGLIGRLTLDRGLPQSLLKTNRRGTTHRIIIGFFVLSVAVLLMTGGELGALAGVYTISFLAVMALFGIGNVLLKVRREHLPRPTTASWPTVLAGIVAVLLGLIGNIVLNPAYARVFLYFFVPTVLFVFIMLGRIQILQAILYFIRRISDLVAGWTSATSQTLRAKIDQINAQQFVFFTRGDNLAALNEVMLYVRENEHTNRIKVVTVAEYPEQVPERLEQDLKFLDEAYPEIHIDFMVIKGVFTPKLIRELSAEWQIPLNFMFLGSPGDHFLYGLSELGGVRLII